MNFFDIFRLFQAGGSIWAKLSALLFIGAGVAAGYDQNKTGVDDLIAGIAASAADGLTAYDKKDFNRVGNVIDAMIAGLNTLKTQLTDAGLIKPRELAPPVSPQVFRPA